MIAITKKDIDNLLSLPSFGILANGRAGTDFLQSLFDGHPEVLTFNGFFLFYDFWDLSFTNKSNPINYSDFIDEFVGKFLFKFKSRYDIQEQKDKLGPEANQSLDIDLDLFKSYARTILNQCEFSSKNALLAFTASYHLCLGRKLDTIKIFLHHPHVQEECVSFLNDFPDATLIFMTRDPRANIYSSINNYSKYFPNDAGIALITAYFNSILQDINRYRPFTNKIIALKIENLDKLEIQNEICKDLSISYNECLKYSTWGGLLWHGDRLSQKKPSKNNSRDILRNGWEDKISKRDLIIINFFTEKIRNHYGYTNKSTNKILYLLVPLLIIAPTHFETSYLNPNSIRKYGFKKYCANWFYYIKRIKLFINLFLDRKNINDCRFH